VRGLIQIFDPKQYEPCKEGEIDDVYTCRTVDCGPDRKYEDAMCYKPCKAGEEGKATRCWTNCPAGSRTTGLTCERVGCDGKERQGRLCYDPCRAGFSSSEADPLTCLKNCDPGYKAVGVTCYKQCQAGWQDKGLHCERYACAADEEEPNDSKGLCYKKCNAGWRAVGGPNICYQDCPAGWTDRGLLCEKNSCDPGYYSANGRCYKNCQPGMAPVPGIPSMCRTAGCAGGYRDDGATCFRGAHTYGRIRSGWAIGCNPGEWRKCLGWCGHSVHECHSECAEGYRKDPATCHRDAHTYSKQTYENTPGSYTQLQSRAKASYTRGVGKPALQTQPMSSYTRTERYTRAAGTPDLTITARPSYERGPGTSGKVSVRGKKRIVDFSTKTN
jgi:hypothetical protein